MTMSNIGSGFRHSARSAMNLVGTRLGDWRFRLLPYRPHAVRPDEWNAEYAGKDWERLRQVNELAHYSVIVGYCGHFWQGGRVLDVGCGEGILQEKLLPYGYSAYVGLDISAEAVRLASRRQDDKTLFICGDAEAYSTNQCFDIIVFNEALYYFNDPLGVVARYRSYLTTGGVMIVSMNVSQRTKRLWRMLENSYRSLDSVVLANGTGVSWMVRVLAPSTPHPA